MWNTNAAECWGGMHHIRRRCGLSAFFFKRLAHRLVAELGHHLQRHHPFGQEPQCMATIRLSVRIASEQNVTQQAAVASSRCSCCLMLPAQDPLLSKAL